MRRLFEKLQNFGRRTVDQVGVTRYVVENNRQLIIHP